MVVFHKDGIVPIHEDAADVYQGSQLGWFAFLATLSDCSVSQIGGWVTVPVKSDARLSVQSKSSN